MGGAEVLDLARTAIWVTIKIAAPVMLAGLAVGFIVSLSRRSPRFRNRRWPSSRRSYPFSLC
jgi:Flagellar biosynthesis pathway, component FliQ